MNYKRILVLMLVFVLLASGCGAKNAIVDNTASETIAEVPATTEKSVPGVEDSEFSEETKPTETETQTEATEVTEPTEATEPSKPNENTEPSKPTDPVEPETTAPTTEPTEPPAPAQMDYMTFQNMSAADQQAYMATFGGLDQFFAWYNQAKADYEAANPPIDVGDGNVDIGDLIG